jgi:aryl-alcohol dehydrogenase
VGSTGAIDLMQQGKVLRGSVEGGSDPLEMVPRLLELNAAGRFDGDDLVVTYPSEEINQAVADTAAGTVVKPILVW